MEKDIDRIQKSQDIDIVIRIDDFGGRKGVTIREFVKSERYTGFTKSGLRIPADKFKIFKTAINSIDERDLEEEQVPAEAEESDANQKLEQGNKEESKKIEEQEF